MKSFWPKVQEFMYLNRFPSISENQWQKLFFSECGIKEEKGSLDPFNNASFNKRPRDPELDQEKEFMNHIKTKELQDSYFTSRKIS